MAIRELRHEVVASQQMRGGAAAPDGKPNRELFIAFATP